MDFFGAQEVARKKTKLLVLFFVLAIVGIVTAVYALLVAVTWMTGYHEPLPPGASPPLWQPQFFLFAAVGSLTLIVFGSLFKVLQLASGGARVARALGGRLINPDTTDADERRLRNVVEEMAIASGTPVPDVYLLDNETGINAFAAGYSPSDAVIGVTRGCLENLNRDELQGVIAHEFSHILNGDMRLNIRLMGLLFGILMLTVVGRIILRSGFYTSSDRRKGGGVAAVALAGAGLIVVGSIGVFFARLIQAAVSRQREFLADASAVQFTRLPDGIAGALKKIGALSMGSRIVDPHAEEASHMFFADGLVRHFGAAFATHPPLPERIRAIQPSWDGRFDVFEAPRHGQRPSRKERSAASPARGFAASPAAAGFAGEVVLPAPAASLPEFRPPSDDQVARASQLRADVLTAAQNDVHTPFGAQATLLGLLLSPDVDERMRQIKSLQGRVDDTLLQAAFENHHDTAELSAEAKLALIDLAIPALRRLSLQEYERFIDQMRRLVESDNQIDLFEFTLEKILRRHLDVHFGRRGHPTVRFKRLREVADASEVLLSALARIGARDDEQAAHRAFGAGATLLASQDSKLRLQLRPAAGCSLQAVGAALDRLEQAGPLVKRVLLEASGRTILADGVISDQEAQLVRAIADALGTPLPVLSAGKQTRPQEAVT